MKKMMMIFALLSAPVFAESVSEAQALFDSRTNDAAGIAVATQAANMYASLAAKASSTAEKAQLKLKEAEAFYFLGNRVDGKKNILATFEKGYEAAKFAADNLTGSDKAEALYWYAANQGRWGETKGVLASLSRWRGEMKPALIEGMGIDETVQDYGLLRTRGKAYLKVPGESKDKGYNWIKKAYESTLVDVTVDGETFQTSTQVNNTLFFLFAITKRGYDVEETGFCRIYDNSELLFDGGEEAYKTISPKYWTDFEKELNDLFDAKGDFEDVVDYYDENC